MLDLSLLGVAALFCVLSFIKAWVVLKLPVHCQSSWSLIAVHGIMWVGIAESLLRWNQCLPTQQVISDIAIIFLFSFPGILYLDFQQKKRKIHYWQECGIPDELANKSIYLTRRYGFTHSSVHLTGDMD